MSAERAPAMDPTTRFVRSLDGNFFMVREAALMLGVSHRTLRRLIKDDDTPGKSLGPSYLVNFGKVPVYLYTVEDVERIRKHLNNAKQVLPREGVARLAGRPPKWTKDERTKRQRLYVRANYYRARIQTLSTNGRDDEAAQAADRLAGIEKELEAMVA